MRRTRLAVLIAALVLIAAPMFARAQQPSPTVVPSQTPDPGAGLSLKDSLANGLNQISTPIASSWAQSYYRSIDPYDKGAFSYAFLILQFKDADSASKAMPYAFTYLSQLDASGLTPESVRVSPLGDERQGAYLNDNRYRWLDGYLAVRVGPVVWFGETRGTDFNPLTSLVDFATTSTQCITHVVTVGATDFDDCLTPFDAMPAGMDNLGAIDVNHVP